MITVSDVGDYFEAMAPRTLEPGQVDMTSDAMVETVLNSELRRAIRRGDLTDARWLTALAELVS